MFVFGYQSARVEILDRIDDRVACVEKTGIGRGDLQAVDDALPGDRIGARLVVERQRQIARRLCQCRAPDLADRVRAAGIAAGPQCAEPIGKRSCCTETYGSRWVC